MAPLGTKFREPVMERGALDFVVPPFGAAQLAHVLSLAPLLRSARPRARGLAAQLGFGASGQTLISTAISELAPSIVPYAKRRENIVRVDCACSEGFYRSDGPR